MKPVNQRHISGQQGAVSLVVGLVLLTSITLIALLTSKTVAVESQISANHYRMLQALAAANYAMDYGVSYFDNGGFDQNGDDIIDTIMVPDLISTYAGQVTHASVEFTHAAGSRCVPLAAVPDWRYGMLVATGFSDDGLAKRQLTQCVSALNILVNGGAKQALVASGNVRLTGQARIINRYSRNNIWSGGVVALIPSGLATYNNSLAADDAAEVDQEKLNPDSTYKTQLVSNHNLGVGLDIVAEDNGLSTLSGLEFFKYFFALQTQAELRQLAASNGQLYSNMTDLTSGPPKSGLIWLDGPQVLQDVRIGSDTVPAIVFVNGDVTITGESIIKGMIYVAGRLAVEGTPKVFGSCLVAGSDAMGRRLLNLPTVSGAGALTLVYAPVFASKRLPLPGLTAVVAGSWRDW
ncbi:MAG: hypothetical protein WC782_15255 [Methylococcaceae bacterium]|jgi:hypothetical protein